MERQRFPGDDGEHHSNRIERAGVGVLDDRHDDHERGGDDGREHDVDDPHARCSIVVTIRRPATEHIGPGAYAS